MKTSRFGQALALDDRWYVPLSSVLLTAGFFFSEALHTLERYVEPPSERDFRHGVRYTYDCGVKAPIREQAAAWIHGNSMVENSIYDSDLAFFRHSGFEYVEHGKILVIERLGDVEGFGAWCLKKLIIKQSREYRANQFGDIDWERPEEIVLRSANHKINPWHLDPNGRYRVRGVLLRTLAPEHVKLMEADTIVHRLETVEGQAFSI